jgi:hypothetical protein
MTETFMEVFEDGASSGALMAWLREQHNVKGPTAIAERLAVALIASKAADLTKLSATDARHGRDILDQGMKHLAVRFELMQCAIAEFDSRVKQSGSD